MCGNRKGKRTHDGVQPTLQLFICSLKHVKQEGMHRSTACFTKTTNTDGYERSLRCEDTTSAESPLCISHVYLSGSLSDGCARLGARFQ